MFWGESMSISMEVRGMGGWGYQPGVYVPLKALLIPPAFMPTGINLDGHFVFPFVCMFISSLVHYILRQKVFRLKFLLWSISHTPTVRNHSYLDQMYPIGFTLFQCVPSPRVHARGWGHRLKTRIL